MDVIRNELSLLKKEDLLHLARPDYLDISGAEKMSVDDLRQTLVKEIKKALKNDPITAFPRRLNLLKGARKSEDELYEELSAEVKAKKPLKGKQNLLRLRNAKLCSKENPQVCPEDQLCDIRLEEPICHTEDAFEDKGRVEGKLIKQKQARKSEVEKPEAKKPKAEKREEEKIEGLDSIEEIETDIQNKYPYVLTGKDRIQEDTYGKGVYDDGILQSVHSSSHKNDCLVHSFLTALIPSFRKLKRQDKDEYADFFRRVVLVQKLNKKFSDDLLAEGFLQDNEADALAVKYHVSIITIEENTIDLQKTLRTFVLNWEKRVYPFIILYNPGDYHFRPVRVIKSGRFFFSQEEGRKIWDKLQKRLEKPETKKRRQISPVEVEIISPKKKAREVSPPKKAKAKIMPEGIEKEFQEAALIPVQTPSALTREKILRILALPTL